MWACLLAFSFFFLNPPAEVIPDDEQLISIEEDRKESIYDVMLRTSIFIAEFIKF